VVWRNWNRRPSDKTTANSFEDCCQALGQLWDISPSVMRDLLNRYRLEGFTYEDSLGVLDRLVHGRAQ